MVNTQNNKDDVSLRGNGQAVLLPTIKGSGFLHSGFLNCKTKQWEPSTHPVTLPQICGSTESRGTATTTKLLLLAVGESQRPLAPTWEPSIFGRIRDTETGWRVSWHVREILGLLTVLTACTATRSLSDKDTSGHRYGPVFSELFAPPRPPETCSDQNSSLA